MSPAQVTPGSWYSHLRSVVSLRLLGLILFACLAAPGAAAQVWDLGEEPIEVVVKAESTETAAGSEVALLFEVAVSDGWAVYSADTTGGPAALELKIAASDHYEALPKVEGPKPKRKWDEGFEVEVGYHTGKPVFKKWIRIDPAASGAVQVKGEVIAQACSATTCLAPESFPFTLEINVEGGGPTAQKPADPTAEPAPKDPSPDIAGTIAGVPDALMNAGVIATFAGLERDENAFLAFLRGGVSSEENQNEDEGGLGMLLAGFLAGLLALATPCVYPMIPITVSFFAKLGEEKSGRPVLPALVYCLGIIASFTALGFLLTVLLGASGAQDFGTSPWVNGAVGLLFVVFALWLFGMFELQLPRFLTNLGGAGAKASGYSSVLLMGLTFAVTSFACTGPFVGALLFGAATSGYLGPTLGMAGFSTALALPFFFLALVPQMLAGLPKSGGWMLTVKVVMGFLVLGAAFKFLSGVDSVLGWGILGRETVLGIYIAVCLAGAMYLFGLFRFPHEQPVESISVGRMAVALIFLVISIRMVPGLFGAGLGELDAFLPESQSAQSGLFAAAGEDGIDWISDLEEAERLARETGKPLFLHFTGHTCSNCKWMKANMFTRPAVRDEIARFIPVELYTDRLGDPVEERNKEFRESKFNTVAVPLYAIVEI